MTGRLFLLLLFLVLQAASHVVVAASALDEGEALVNSPMRNLESRIIGGVKADPKRNPYFTQLGVAFNSPSSAPYTYGCGGTLIGTDVVLTTASCLTPQSPSDSRSGIYAWVNATSINTSPYEYYRKGIRSVTHPLFDKTLYTNDIALIFLDTRVTGVTMPKINRNASAPAIGKALFTVGLGYLKSSPVVKATYLMSVSINALNPSACSAYFRFGFKGVNQICAGGAKGTCNGDSGGPLVVRGASASTDLLVGVASYGTAAGCGLYPSAWTRVSKYATWITSNICKFSKFKPSTCA
ncbi:serine-type endopeptidase [Fragilaria crotonensis]|nr:serine-type endopeptidase [Fragilaria crotonensis]